MTRTISDEDISDFEAIERASTQASTAPTPIKLKQIGTAPSPLSLNLSPQQEQQSSFASKIADGNWENAKKLVVGEPDEHALVLESLKRASRRRSGHASSARQATVSVQSRFNFSLSDRARTAFSEPSSFRPSSSKHIDFTDLGINGEAASDLTCAGFTAGGSALAAARARRAQSGNDLREVNMDIRSLLQKYETYSQQSCLSASELKERRHQSEQRRPGTPADVRIQTLRPTSSSGRPPSSSGRPTSATSRPSTATNKRPPSRAKTSASTNHIMPMPVLVGAGETLVLDNAAIDLS